MDINFVSKMLFYSKASCLEHKLVNAFVSDSYKNKVEKLASIYEDMKSLSSYICGDVKRDERYLALRDILVNRERHVFAKEFICESKPDFDPLDSRYTSGLKREMDVEEFLDLLVWLTRTSLYERYKDLCPEIENIDDLSLTDECYIATYTAKSLCDGFKVKCKSIKILPGFTDRIKLFDGHGYHFFLMVTLDSGEYIVDCTYRQFFALDRNLPERMGVYGLSGCHPGFYMMRDPQKKKVADTLLKRGWIKATPDNFKHYMDGFALSFRNGLYYERHDEVEMKTPYTFYDYNKFLIGEGDQIRLEGEECLATQESVLEDKGYCKKLI